MDTSKISQYILSQIKAGLTPEDIAAQLRGAGWQEADIVAGFEAAQAQIVPPPTQPPAAPMPAHPDHDQPVAQTASDEPVSQLAEHATVGERVSSSGVATGERQQLPPPIKRGRLKTGWLLFKQSFGIIKSSPALWRYMVMSMVFTMALVVVLMALVMIDINTTNILAAPAVGGEYSPTLAGYGVMALFTAISTSITFYYATALSSHVLTIFRGEQSTYHEHIKLARSKLPAIITYALITVTVGFILRQLEQRFRLVGWIISKTIGVLWALATTFVISIIADSEANSPAAIKQSIALFRQTWAETITSRVTLGGVLFLIYFLVMLPVTFVLLFVLGATFGVVGAFIALGLFFIGVIVLAILDTLATNILNVSLYYYARYGVIPPSFSPELLASVFVEKKKKK